MRFRFAKASFITIMAAALPLLAFSSSPASAQALAENSTIVPTQEYPSVSFPSLGTQVAFEEFAGSSSFFNGTDTLILNFIARSAVYLDPNGSTYNFVYQVENTTPVNPGPGFVSDSIGAFSIGAYPTAVSTEIFYNTTGNFLTSGFFFSSNEVADFVDRTSGATGTLTFRFQAPLDDAFDTGPSGKVDPGENSAIMIVRTNATSFSDHGAFSVIDGVATTVPGYAPAGVLVPEPGTLALAAGPLLLGAFGIARRRRRKKA